MTSVNQIMPLGQDPQSANGQSLHWRENATGLSASCWRPALAWFCSRAARLPRVPTGPVVTGGSTSGMRRATARRARSTVRASTSPTSREQRADCSLAGSGSSRASWRVSSWRRDTWTFARTVQRDVTGGSVTSGADLGAFAALSGRLGVVLGRSWLAYGRAGLVVAQMRGSTVQTCTTVDLCGGAQSTPVSSATTRDVSFGLLLGAGVEYKLSEHWNGRLEYQFIGLRKELALPARRWCRMEQPGRRARLEARSELPLLEVLPIQMETGAPQP